jgi:hypothetical protein
MTAASLLDGSVQMVVNKARLRCKVLQMHRAAHLSETNIFMLHNTTPGIAQLRSASHVLIRSIDVAGVKQIDRPVSTVILREAGTT